jgi:quercetin dioxygenase-like cupin family protein
VEHRLAEGDPAEETLRLAEALKCDLVVMGTHGKTGLGRLLTGSVAEAVLRKAQCPVLVVKSAHPALPGAELEMTAAPGAVVDVRPLGSSLATAATRTLVRTPALEVVRLVVSAGQKIALPSGKAALIIHCLEGRIALTALGKTQPLEARTLVHLPAGEPHAFQGIEDASLLLTVFVPKP